MSSDVLKLVLAAFTTFLGGGAVQLIIALFRRKSELRQVDTQSDVNTATATATQATAADTLINRLQQDGETYRGIVKEAQADVTRMMERSERTQRDHVEQLRTAHEENGRLTTRVAQLQTDNDILSRQIRDLTDRRPYDPLTGRT